MEKEMRKSCEICEFNMGTVCGGFGKRTDNGAETYGMFIEETERMFPNGCEDWGISLEAYVEQEEMKKR
ncbi:MAG: hypothetical protein UHS49_01925 [Faecalimonas sp.]|nr:hypothetical protein [Faecalimonas sp.]